MPEPLPDGAAALADLPEPERRAALLLVYGTNGDVALAAARARELAPRDPVEARLLALMDLLGPAAAKAVVAGSPLGARLVNALAGVVDTLDKHRGRGQQTRQGRARPRPPRRAGGGGRGRPGRGVSDESSINPMRRVSRMNRAPRCGARTRSGSPCRQPKVRGRPRCRMHGGAGRRRPRASVTGRWRHGQRSGAVLAERAMARLLLGWRRLSWRNCRRLSRG